jgi:tetratricopeptide (TPR) repeat protein
VVSPYYVQLGQPKDLFKEAGELAHRAIERDANNSEAYSVLGFISMVFDRNWQEAEQQLQHSVAIHPSDASNLNLFGDYLYTVGDYLAALDVEGQAAELEPLSAANQHELALVNFFLGRYDKAIALEHLAVQLNEQFSNAWSTLARIYLFTGRDEELQQLLNSDTAQFSPSFRLWLGVMPGVRTGVATAKGAQIADLASLAALAEQGEMPPTQVAYAFAMTGDDAKAAEWINRAYASRDPILVSPLYFFLPDDWHGLPLTRSALDQPGLAELYELRRRYITAGSGRVGN